MALTKEVGKKILVSLEALRSEASGGFAVREGYAQRVQVAA